jgi:hypothetical protein
VVAKTPLKRDIQTRLTALHQLPLPSIERTGVLQPLLDLFQLMALPARVGVISTTDGLLESSTALEVIVIATLLPVARLVMQLIALLPGMPQVALQIMPMSGTQSEMTVFQDEAAWTTGLSECAGCNPNSEEARRRRGLILVTAPIFNSIKAKPNCLFSLVVVLGSSSVEADNLTFLTPFTVA